MPADFEPNSPKCTTFTGKMLYFVQNLEICTIISHFLGFNRADQAFWLTFRYSTPDWRAKQRFWLIDL
jgi:hypothetical protein